MDRCYLCRIRVKYLAIIYVVTIMIINIAGLAAALPSGNYKLLFLSSFATIVMITSFVMDKDHKSIYVEDGLINIPVLAPRLSIKKVQVKDVVEISNRTETMIIKDKSQEIRLKRFWYHDFIDFENYLRKQGIKVCDNAPEIEKVTHL